MKEYKIVSGANFELIEKEVNEMIKDGWELHGSLAMSVSVTVGFNYVIAAQAMIREEKPKVDG